MTMSREFKFTEAKCPFDIDPAVRALTAPQLRQHVAEFQALLNEPCDEHTLHAFLAGRSYFFNDLIRLYNPFPVYSKVKLGHQHEMDFVCVEVGSLGVEWRFVEIESPAKCCFTKSDELSADFFRAVEQVRTWSGWFRENISYAGEMFPYLDQPSFFLFMGKRSDLNERRRNALKRFQYDCRQWLTVRTLDRFGSMAESCENLVREDGGHWLAPLRAYSHAEFASRSPAPAFAWLDDNEYLEDASSRYLADRMSEREARAVREVGS